MKTAGSWYDVEFEARRLARPVFIGGTLWTFLAGAFSFLILTSILVPNRDPTPRQLISFGIAALLTTWGVGLLIAGWQIRQNRRWAVVLALALSLMMVLAAGVIFIYFVLILAQDGFEATGSFLVLGALLLPIPICLWVLYRAVGVLKVWPKARPRAFEVVPAATPTNIP